jgi:hypothetical protein
MATIFTISEIVADIARTANVPDFSSTTNVTANQITYWLTMSARSLSARIRSAFGENADYLRVAELQTQAGLNTLSLPTDAGEVHAVLWRRTSSDFHLLFPGSLNDLEDLADGDIQPWRDFGEPKYRLEGEQIAFYPPSSEVENITVFYTGHLDLSGETFFASRLDADRLITLDVAIRVLQAQGRDASVLLQDKLMLEQHFFSPSRNRQPTRSVSIRDVRSLRGDRIRSRWSR